jgi:serine/threonine-protein kinase RsbW
MAPTLSLHIATTPHSIRLARKLLYATACLAGASEETARDIELAVGEALTNILRHAYENGVGPAEVDITCERSGLTLVVRDWGAAKPLPELPAMLPRDATSGGRGLYLIRRLMDTVEVQHNPEGRGMTVRLSKGFENGAPRFVRL